MPNEKSKAAAKAPKVYSLCKASRCYQCDVKQPPGSIVLLKHGGDESEVLCQPCAGLSNFEALPSGNAKLTRLAPKYSPTYYVVMRWSELWKCYERQGLLIEREALQKLKDDCSAS